jgi:hypothetical protein
MFTTRGEDSWRVLDADSGPRHDEEAGFFSEKGADRGQSGRRRAVSLVVA